MKPIIWAVVPARSGSKGLPGKNIRDICGQPLIGHTIRFAQACGVFDRIIASTDSPEYAAIAEQYGADVPFLRSASAATDSSMEEDILADMAAQLNAHGIQAPDVLVWLRPTFPFRKVADLTEALALLTPQVDSVRLVTEGEPRLYAIRNERLEPMFDDQGRSMIRRQEFAESVKVFHTDIFWFRNIALGQRFLGEVSVPYRIHKICSTDIDTREDAEIAESLMRSGSSFIRAYTHAPND